MAKANPAKSDSSKPVSKPKPKSPTRKASSSTTVKSKPVNDQPGAFTGIAIGHAAGEIWGLLSSGGPRTIADIKKSVKAPGDVVVAAIGWLAREHKLEFDTNGKTVKIGLR
jgi:hypothetical protein